MTGARQSFLAGLVDYAGLFPPAALDMAAAVAEYARHRKEDERAMLGRFIVPASRLAELAAAADEGVRGTDVWPLSVLVGDRAGLAEIEAALPGQAAAAGALPAGFVVEALECVLPGEPGARSLLAAVAGAGLAGAEIFCEVPPGADDEALIADLAAAAKQADGFTRIGAKLRCGGVTPDAFPSCGRIAAVIDGCRRQGLPLKCTAGLHHPVRHRSSEPDVMMHGFLNVYGAGLLAHALDAGRDTLVACLEETEPAAFRLDGEAFAWREHTVTAADVARLRASALCGFGSCSFDEPRADLRALRIL